MRELSQNKNKKITDVPKQMSKYHFSKVKYNRNIWINMSSTFFFFLKNVNSSTFELGLEKRRHSPKKY